MAGRQASQVRRCDVVLDFLTVKAQEEEEQERYQWCTHFEVECEQGWGSRESLEEAGGDIWQAILPLCTGSEPLG